MFTVVYVVVDDDKLIYYNEMMKSLVSLHMHMPEQKVAVLMDSDTYERIQQQKSELFDMAEVMPVQISDEYTMVEKSRLLKVTVRKRLNGDLLFIDTDTVICDRLPPIESDKSIAMVLEFHSLRSEVNWHLTDKYDKQSGLDLNNFDYFYNSGVIWSRDDEHAHRFYRKWHELWEQTRKNGIPRDQSPFNYIVQQEFEHIETLDGVWNVQLARAFSMGLNYLADAHIIHYFNHPTSAYLLCHEAYQKLPYNDPQILEMLKRPKSLFGKCRLIGIDGENNVEDQEFLDWCKNKGKFRYFQRTLLPVDQSLFMAAVIKTVSNKKMFACVENMLKCLQKVKHIFVR